MAFRTIVGETSVGARHVMPFRPVLFVYAWLVPTATYIALIAVAVVSFAAWLAISRTWDHL